MFNRFYPDEDVASAYDIPYDALYKKGIRGVIFDVDNTLVPHDAPADERAKNLFSHLRALGMDTCLLSNNKEPRVAAFAEAVGGSNYIYKGGKPGVKNYKKAMELMGTSLNSTIFVGDGNQELSGEADQSEGRDSDRIKTVSGGTYLIFLSQGQKEETV